MRDVIEVRGRLQRVFEGGFRVVDIAESLVSFDAEKPAANARAFLERRRFRVAGVRENGVVTGYVLTRDLSESDRLVGDFQREFEADEIVAGDGYLSDAIRKLANRDRLFVTSFGKVGGIATRTDLQKPLVRMWLFGMITMIEMSLTRMIDVWYPDESWTKLASRGRLQKARDLLRERRRRHQGGELRLLDCLQFTDKAQILTKDADVRRVLGVRSKSAGDEVFKRLGSLRNNLAHSQDILTDGWDAIVTLAEHLDDVLRVGSTFQVNPRFGK